MALAPVFRCKFSAPRVVSTNWLARPWLVRGLAPGALVSEDRLVADPVQSTDVTGRVTLYSLPELGNIVFYEDPSLPLDNDDWPEESDEADS